MLKHSRAMTQYFKSFFYSQLLLCAPFSFPLIPLFVFLLLLLFFSSLPLFSFFSHLLFSILSSPSLPFPTPNFSLLLRLSLSLTSSLQRPFVVQPKLVACSEEERWQGKGKEEEVKEKRRGE